MNKYLIAVAVLVCGAGWAEAQTSSGPNIQLGGDRFPDRTISQVQTFCGSNSILVKLQSDINNPTTLLDVVVNGNSYVDRPEYKELHSFIGNLRFPQVTSLFCSSNDIAVVIGGYPIKGENTTYKVNFPFAR